MEKNIQAYIKEFIPYVVIIIVVVLIKLFVVSPIRVNGVSMEPTLKDKDIMLLNEISYRFTKIERFQIIVIHYEDENIIKRVIGLPGETVEYQNQKLYINGKVVKEKFTHEKTEDFEKVVVPEGEYFVLGDNRGNSTDSRIIGTVPIGDIKGTTNFTIYSFSRFGKKQ